MPVGKNGLGNLSYTTTMENGPRQSGEDRYLDLSGLDCPIPVLKAKLALAEMRPGEVIHVLATDPHSTVDFEAFCARTGHEMLHAYRDSGGGLHFHIRHRAGARA